MERSHLTAWLALLLCVIATAATPSPAHPPTNCPADCVCSLSQHTHKPLYHLKCNSTQGLRLADKSFQSAIPVHSIDLSHLNLTRLSHVLDKLPELTSADLSHNELKDLGHLGQRLKRLNLKHNRLTSDKLPKLPQHLQVLNLQHNNITQLPLELTHMHQLRQLELSHNAINCSCQTLEVRNWLVERIVYMEHPVVCSHPPEFKGRSWLQLKQDEICRKEQHKWFDSDVEENELMMGDQPAAVSAEREDEEELGKDFLPIDGKVVATSKKARSPQEPLPGDQVEGSGDLSNANMEMVQPLAGDHEPEAAESQVEAITSAPQIEQKVVEDDDDDAEASGSGGGLLIIPDVSKVKIASDDDIDGKQGEEENDSRPVESPDTDVFRNMGIFEGSKDNKGSEEEKKPVEEEVIVPVVLTNLGTGVKSEVVTDGPVEDSAESEDLLAAKVGHAADDSNAIYYLLAVIGLIVVGLVIFVAMKRCKYDSNAAARDAEAQRQTELLDMDKKQLGKPLHKNGHGNGQEHSPLIGEKTKLDEAQIVKKAYGESAEAKDGAGQQPLLNGNGSANGNAKEATEGNEPAAHEYYPISPRYPTPQSPRASKYAQQQQQQQPAEQNNNNEPDGAYLPSSPKSGRYSPVYSPETGRVKIKLTETPRPKTPMLVTRSKSNAGDIITTPVKPIEPPTHQAVTININGH
ncbi:protein windpipe [Drosophila elegans]|uniref:protein windpipe n=1 Tax=Drosophila elegans TaxID=30023 RepID=UPI001BC86443|nr:protein windpipe [Drosophila elegans]XP_017131900.2 protein windpipe [Drosophila elegans]XP_041565750.1 protein windpipe [Drosophila elegans]XP_041565751.1 protein windpipe [Drosophila elegans]XP_041565752.1 protein windpipe [Drosophila elegans]